MPDSDDDSRYEFKPGDKVAFMEPGKSHYQGMLPGTVIARNPTGYLVETIGGKRYSVTHTQITKSARAKSGGAD